MSKTGNANAKAPACNYGATCRKYGCSYAHPKARKGDCRFGDRCHKDGCKFLHPKGHTPGDSTTYPVARTGGKNAGGGSKGFRSVHLRLDTDDSSRSVTVRNEERQLCFAASVDSSGSMAGSRIRAAVEGLGTIVQGMMRPQNLFGLVTFNTDVKNLHKPMPRAKVNWAKDGRHIQNNVGGCTALWDAVIAGIHLLKEVMRRRKEDPDRKGKPKLVFEQLVITDGLDNSSSASFEEVRDLVRSPGLPDYHLRVIAVTSDMERGEILQLEQLCKPAHAQLLPASDVGQLKAVLQKEAERLTLLLRETDRRTGHTRKQTKQLAKGSDRAILQQLAGLKLLRSAA